MDVVIQRGKKVELESLPDYSIALDGFVPGPKVDTEHHRISFDHHDNCLRYCTTSACMQAWTAVLLGLDPAPYTIYANDVDSDVCIAVWCLRNPDRCEDPLVKKLVDAVGLGDMHGGAFPFPNNGMLKTVEWVSAPETDSKRNNDYSKLSDAGLYSILEAVLHRVDLYVDGEASIEVAKQPRHGEYKVLRNEHDWVLTESQDPHAFGAIYQAGFDRIVLTRPQSDGSLAVTIAKRSDFVGGFPIPKMYDALNSIEPGWGGGSTVGGAPRNPDGSRSKMSLEKIIEVIDTCVKNG
ncbi:MAG TPA: hypothetical protein VM577_13205 [Anaerovoracaceae bacterium]|nr:hypothetical protein [Anaerovoracaceae bacterium]